MAVRDLFKKKKKNRACVVGIDGLPHSLVQRLIENGTWPFTAGLCNSGVLHKMKVTLPEISAVSWPSFMTGSNPGVHGIFGFTELRNDYSMRFTNFSDLKCKTFWDRIGEQGKSSVVINQPGTYPAREIPGVLVSGFVAIELGKAVKPLKYLAALRRAHYEIDIDTQRCRRDHDQLFVELKKTMKGRREIMNAAWQGEDWDYFQVVITGTDRLQHYLWSAVEDEGHERHGQAMEYYAAVDGFIKDAWEKFHSTVDVSREGEGFFMLSDHGFCGIKQEVNLNAWLRAEGWLSFEKDAPEGVQDISPRSKAFCLDPGRIYIHRKNRYRKGTVEDGEAQAIAAKIKEKLESLCYHGEEVIQAVKTRDEAYQGPEAEKGPDLVAVPNHGFDLKGAPGKTEVFEKGDLTGMHTWDDAFFWSAEDQGDELNIVHLADIVTKPLF